MSCFQVIDETLALYLAQLSLQPLDNSDLWIKAFENTLYDSSAFFYLCVSQRWARLVLQ